MSTKNKTIYLATALLGLSLLLHLVALGYPAQVVFDEVHFGKFVTAYCCSHENFFDIHPPHGKLLIAAAAYLGGYRGNFAFEDIGQAYPEDSPVAAFRLVPALFGSLLPLIIFVILRQLGGSLTFAFLGGWLVLFENALLVQSRFMLIDAMLLVGIFGALACWLAAERSGGARRWLWFVWAGGLAGLAVGTKFTGLVALGLLGFLLLIRLLHSVFVGKPWSRWLLVGLVIVGSALVVYGAGWLIHFALLTQPGDGDAFYTLDYSAPLVARFIPETLSLHRVMLEANYNLPATHTYTSAWWSWPLMTRSVFYWVDSSATIYFLGNPLVWWGIGLLSLVAVASYLVPLLRRLALERPLILPRQLWLPLVGYGGSMLPLVAVPRVLFLYHYLTPLLFSLLFSLLWLNGQLKQVRVNYVMRYYYVAVLSLVALTFVWFSPLSYGWPIPGGLDRLLFWFPGWR